MTGTKTDDVPGAIDISTQVKFSATGRLSATTSPPSNGSWADDLVLAAGALTLDLTALAGAPVANQDFTDMRLQLIAIECPEDNTAAVTVDVGAANGYQFMGSADDYVTVQPGGVFFSRSNNNVADISASLNSIDFGSTDLTADVYVAMVAG
jgi:hypothetical protein